MIVGKTAMAGADTPHQPTLFFFRRTFANTSRRRRGVFDALPLLDVILLLFLFFLVWSPFVLQPGVRVELPSSEFTDGAPYGGLVVTLTQEGWVYFNDGTITMDGLAAAFRRAVYEQAQTTLLVEADGRVRYEVLIAVSNMARDAGIKDVVLGHRMLTPEASDEP
jgi:biopolymer transport protein ExbD